MGLRPCLVDFLHLYFLLGEVPKFWVPRASWHQAVWLDLAYLMALFTTFETFRMRCDHCRLSRVAPRDTRMA